MEFHKVLKKSLFLIFTLDREVVNATFLSICVSGSSIIFATLFGVTFAVLVSLTNFKGKKIVIAFINSFLYFPAVVIGLLLYILFSRRSIFGAFDLLYTPYIMVIAQTILATPIVCALSINIALQTLPKAVSDLSLTLGANRIQLMYTLIKEARASIITAIITGFARIIGETGMTMMVGGNIKGYTRVLTTTIALETMKGNFELGIALGIILFLIAVVINISLQILQSLK